MLFGLSAAIAMKEFNGIIRTSAGRLWVDRYNVAPAFGLRGDLWAASSDVATGGAVKICRPDAPTFGRSFD